MHPDRYSAPRTNRMPSSADRTAHLTKFRSTMRLFRLITVTTIHVSHPHTGCLPVPQIRVPGTADTLAATVRELADNLWESGTDADPLFGAVAGPWATARWMCPHLPGDQIGDLWSLIRSWHRFLRSCQRYIENDYQGTRTAIDSVGARFLLDARHYHDRWNPDDALAPAARCSA